MKHLKEHSIIASGFTARHIHKIAKQFSVDLKALEIEDLPFPPRVHGRKDDEWVVVNIGDISVHFMVDTFRQQNDLVDYWLNPVEEEFLEWNKRVDNLYYGKKK